ncbi:membrane protein [Streptomyces sp. KM77-8]|uniref:Membrane protein n=1 Tax=Streptomyces haneummycinicus TaxID=3074435 RepID=A0AAT9HSN9_9ACTN
MANDWARGVLRRGAAVSGTAAALTLCGALAGPAYADETNTASHNGHRVGLINAGQIDDPAEDVLEHTLLFGDGYRWD